MDIHIRPTIKKSSAIELKNKPKFSDWIETSSEEEEKVEHENKRIVIESKEDSDEKVLTISKPTKEFKKTVKSSRSPFSFSIKEHSERELDEK
jgi:hypothetical protein